MITNMINKLYFKNSGETPASEQTIDVKAVEVDTNITRSESTWEEQESQTLREKANEIAYNAGKYLRKKVDQVSSKAEGRLANNKSERQSLTYNESIQSEMTSEGARDRAIGKELDRKPAEKDAETFVAYTQAGLEVGAKTINTAVERGKEKSSEVVQSGKEKLDALRSRGREIIDKNVTRAQENFDGVVKSAKTEIDSIGKKYNSANSRFEKSQSDIGENMKGVTKAVGETGKEVAEEAKAIFEGAKQGCDNLKKVTKDKARNLWTKGKAHLKTKLQNAANRL